MNSTRPHSKQPLNTRSGCEMVLRKKVRIRSCSVSEVIEQPHGHPVIVEELVNDSLQVD